MRVAYAPLNRILFELKTKICIYIATGAKHGKTETRLTAPDASPLVH